MYEFDFVFRLLNESLLIIPVSNTDFSLIPVIA